MKNHKSYPIGSLCMVLATVILLIASAYLVPALAPGSQSNVAQALVEDPLVGFTFRLDLGGAGPLHAVGFFTRCSHIGSENEVVEQKETDGVMKVPGKLAWNNVILSRGISSDTQLWEWRKLVEEWKMNDARQLAYITMLDQTMADVAQWKLTEAWPCRIEGPNVLGSGEISIEEIEIVCGLMERVF